MLLAATGALQRADLTLAAARFTYLLLAVYGLQLLARDTGQPSLGHAAFLAVGAYGSLLLRLRAGIDGLSAVVFVAVVAGGLGWLLGLGVTRLQSALLALLTWVLGWAVYLGLGAFPMVSGGVAGITARQPMRVRWEPLGVDLAFTDGGHLALGTMLLALLLLLYRSAQTSSLGRAWALLRERPVLATSLGYNVARLRLAAFAVSAALAALAGGLGAQLVGVADPAAYSPVQSLNLLAAVLVGAPLGFFGPVAGALLTTVSPFIADQVSGAASLPLGTGREIATAALTVVALGVSVRLRGRHRADARGLPLPPPAATPGAGKRRRPRPGSPPPPGGEVVLFAQDLQASFDGVRALDGAGLSLHAGTIQGLIGPNGSGKSTLLRCLVGSTAYGGSVSCDQRRLDPLGQGARVRAGVTGTSQGTAVVPGLTALEHAEAGLAVRSSHATWAQALLRTPAYRGEAISRRLEAAAILDVFGLGDQAAVLAGAMSGGRQRLLQVATAAATSPRVLLLDEPSAGMDQEEIMLLKSGIQDVAKKGVAILMVEHNMGFLAATAGSITVLESGRVLLEGTPRQVAADPAVRVAYLGGEAASLGRPPRRAATRKPSVPRPRPRRV
ncbi:MAG: hypothetical protein NVS3B24_09450 [Candidatus Dormibacteria bacterium]